MLNPPAGCDGEGHAGSVRSDGNAGCSGCAVSGCVGVHVGRRPGAGGGACVEEGGSGGGGDKEAGSVGLGSTGNGGHDVVPSAPSVLCGAGWSGGACGILG